MLKTGGTLLHIFVEIVICSGFFDE